MGKISVGGKAAFSFPPFVDTVKKRSFAKFGMND